MKPAWVPLAEITLTSTDSEITFGSIPNTYRDLIVVVQTPSGASGGVDFYLNSDTANRTSVYGYGLIGNETASFSDTNFVDITSNDSSRIHTYQVMDYSATNKHKTVLARLNIGTIVVAMMAGRWASTSAVNTITLVKAETAFPIGSTFALYGSNKL